MDYDRFLHYSNTLLSSGVLGDIYVELSKLKSPNSQFMYTRAQLYKNDMMINTLDVDHHYKDLNVSTTLRLKGNEYFNAKNYARAARKYTKCMMNSDPHTENHALALANRSAAYFHMGKYELSLKDAHWAMGSNYPSRLSYKLYKLAGQAQRNLGFVEQAIGSYAECLTRLDESDMSAESKREFRATIEKAVAECEELLIERREEVKEIRVDEQLVGGSHEKIPALSAFVELKMSDSMGRGVYATRDINPGDVVAIDEPCISIPISDYTDVCHYDGCLKSDMALFPCPKCLLVYYCNKDCMNKANKEGHYLECPIIAFIKSTPGIPRINELAMKWFLKNYLKMGFEKYCSIVDDFSKSKIDPQTRGFDETGQYKSDNFLTAYSLDSGEEQLSIDVLFFFNCISVDMLHFLKLSGFEIPERYIASVGASLVRMLIVLDFNSRKLSINAPYISLKQDLRLTLKIALTLYPTISLFNHSCDPNIKRSGELSDRIRVMKAIQPIPKGTQLCYTYGVVFKGCVKESRQNFCNRQFYFECHCQPCIKDWPMGRFIPIRLSTLNILDSSMADIVSLECRKFVAFKKFVKSKDYCEHLDYLYSFIKLLFTNVKRPFELYEDCLEMISAAHVQCSRKIYFNQSYPSID